MRQVWHVRAALQSTSAPTSSNHTLASPGFCRGAHPGRPMPTPRALGVGMGRPFHLGSAASDAPCQTAPLRTGMPERKASLLSRVPPAWSRHNLAVHFLHPCSWPVRLASPAMPVCVAVPQPGKVSYQRPEASLSSIRIQGSANIRPYLTATLSTMVSGPP
jgi:hypothetical protein